MKKNLFLMENERDIVQEALERRILKGLACEWEAALLVLDPDVRSAMRRPSFFLTDTRHQLGSWSKEKRIITVSRNLVMECAWDDVRDVLLHEMAHQLATEVLNTVDETSHGPTFKQACRMLRANPKASGNFQPLNARVHSEAESTEDKLIRRVRKLMALAQSGNRNEAEAAMAKAGELMKKYNIDSLTKGSENSYVSVFVGEPALRHFREAYYLANLIEDFYFVKGIWVPAYVLAKGKMGRALEISGTAPNIQIAVYVHHFVNGFINRQWAAYNRSRQRNRYRKTDFAVGVLNGFRATLESRQHVGEESVKIEAAIVPLSDHFLNDYMQHRYPCIRSFQRGTRQVDGNVMAAGEEIGKTLVISKGIETKGRGAPAAITHARD